jgi:N-carbamoylputrescine amidase
MNVTVCQLDDDPEQLQRDWQALAGHVAAARSDLVVLPEMPCAPWFAARRTYDPGTWQAAVDAHERWLDRLGELGDALVAGTRPVNTAHGRRNEAFLWSANTGYLTAHHKVYLPDDEGFWEASWYGRGQAQFAPVDAGGVRIGFLICTELWFFERARQLGQAGVHLLVTPRSTLFETREKWLVGGRAAAVVSGAYQVSSNRTRRAAVAPRFGDWGWVIDPDGEVLGLTSTGQPCVTCEINLQQAEAAKLTYPRYVAG